MAIAPGTKIGPYEIQAPLGEGGMGAVYQAHDPTLQRTVAIKVLAKQDEDASARLLQEARAASALNHPHICTIHEVGEHEGQAFIVMEHVEGKPLSALIPSDGLPPESVIRYGTQIADALAHAHERGVVHRDLKSANVVITPEGRAKVLDFGLAKRMPRADADAVTRTQETLTQPGMLVGTLAYMAPEVLRGEAATARSDIWALGVLLYEMASGRLPFGGKTGLDLATAIVRESPASLTGQVSTGFRAIVQHCLAKEPAQRYGTAAEARAALETIQSDSGTQPASIAPVGVTRTWRVAAALIGLVLVAGVIGYWLRPGPETRTAPRSTVPRLSNPVQVTSAVGVEGYPTWSPDGQMLAYESNQAGNWDIWAVQPGSSQPVNRTADYAGVDRGLSWSPDGSQIAFLSDRDGDRGVFVMSPLGGPPRKLGTFSGRAGGATQVDLQWLADGTALATKVGGSDWPLDGEEGDVFVEILTVATGETRRALLPGLTIDRHELQWSPDEQYLAYIDTSSQSNEIAWLRVLRIVDGEATAITDGLTRNLSPSWSADSKMLYYVSNRGGSLDLWQQPMDAGIPVGDPERVTVGVGMQSATFSPDGSRLAYVRGGNLGNLWRVPVFADRPATWADAEQLTFDEARIDYVDVSSDGDRVAFNSERSGNQDIWVMPTAGGEMQQLTTDRAPDISPNWSPDGQQLTFYSLRSGNRDVWIMPAAGGTARQLTTHEATDWFPSWSPDGTEIAFGSNRNGNDDIWVVAAAGGEPRQVSDDRGPDYQGKFSPDGRWLTFQRQGAVWRVPTAGGEPERLTNGSEAKWRLDSQELYFVRRNTAGQRNVWVVSLANSAERQVTELSDSRPGNFRFFSTEGDYVYFTWREIKGDIWVMDVVQDEANGSDD